MRIRFRQAASRPPLARRALPACGAGLLTLAALLGAAPAPVRAAEPLTVATWNLGWHLDAALATRWIAACGQRFARGGDGLWRPDPAGAKTGWELRWGRDAKIAWDIATLPPCDVWQHRHRPVPVTEGALAKRRQQIAQVLARGVQADVIAFQEVSGVQAVREILPDGGRDWEVCGHDTHKVQRLAFAWRRALGARGACELHAPLALPDRPATEQPRPGLALTLRHQGRVLRFLTVHLKSSCVSPLEGGADDRGRLDGDNRHCQTLQAQLAPLEQWLTAQAAGADALVMLGDFNRNLAHEASLPASEPVRPRGRPTDPPAPGVRSSSLWREVNDGEPASTRLTLLETRCTLGAPLDGLCLEGKSRVLSKDEMAQLTGGGALGCRNPLGLDHIAVRLPAGAATPGAEKVALGRYGQTRAADAKHPDPLLGLSDHCPLKTRLPL